MRKIFLTLIINLISFIACGQRQLTGRVLDSETKKPIEAVTVSVVGDSLTTQTNTLGFFQLTLDTTDLLDIKCDGYSSGQVMVPARGGIQVLLEDNRFPHYQGGFRELYSFWARNFKYPSKARNKNLQGTVFISFEVDTTGSIKNTKILKDIGENCADELIKIVQVTPNKWTPLNKTCTFILPITFRLSKTLDGPRTDAQLLENEMKSVSGKLLSEIVITTSPIK